MVASTTCSIHVSHGKGSSHLFLSHHHSQSVISLLEVFFAITVVYVQSIVINLFYLINIDSWLNLTLQSNFFARNLVQCREAGQSTSAIKSMNLIQSREVGQSISHRYKKYEFCAELRSWSIYVNYQKYEFGIE